MQKAGAYLKSVREEKGYTIQEISKSTKISAPVLRALEEGRINNVDPVYLKGFLKLYCRYLGLDWEAFISEHPIPVLAKKQQKSFSTKPKAKDKDIPVVAAQCAANKKLIAAVLAVIAFLLLRLLFSGVVFLCLRNCLSLNRQRRLLPRLR